MRWHPLRDLTLLGIVCCFDGLTRDEYVPDPSGSSPATSMNGHFSVELLPAGVSALFSAT